MAGGWWTSFTTVPIGDPAPGPVPDVAPFLVRTTLAAVLVGASLCAGLSALVQATTTWVGDLDVRLTAAGLVGGLACAAVFGIGAALDCRSLQARGFRVGPLPPVLWLLVVPAMLIVTLPVYCYVRMRSGAPHGAADAADPSVGVGSPVGPAPGRRRGSARVVAAALAAVVVAVVVTSLAAAVPSWAGMRTFRVDDSVEGQVRRWVATQGHDPDVVGCDRMRVLRVGDTFSCQAFGPGLPYPVRVEVTIGEGGAMAPRRV